MKFFYFGILIMILFVQTAYATHQVETRVPLGIITTVGKLTTLQVDIKNAGSTVEYYSVIITAFPANQIEITNPSITTKNLNPGESISVFSNIRTLTETPIVITIQIFRNGDLSHPSTPVISPISVSSKKFSLPEFGLIGFLQIIAVASVLYFLFGKRVKANQQ